MYAVTSLKQILVFIILSSLLKYSSLILSHDFCSALMKGSIKPEVCIFFSVFFKFIFAFFKFFSFANFNKNRRNKFLMVKPSTLFVASFPDIKQIFFFVKFKDYSGHINFQDSFLLFLY